jgi:L-aspartate oxidase
VAELDVLVVGSGVAGLSAAVRLAGSARRSVGVLTKAELEQSATRWAQGGVAAVLSSDEDSTDLHMADTIAAGAGLCDMDAVRILVNEGPLRVEELVALGAVFDREAGGTFARAREGGHSTARVLHAGGAATGAEVERALVGALEQSAAAIYERWFALDLLVDGGTCVGVSALDPEGALHEVLARNVVLATGGAGQLYAVTTNPPEATGDGIAMALRAGVPVADVEFMQFHPTALHHPAMPRPLLSEALRGHGALLRDVLGERFVDELSPRDVVSRAMAERMATQHADHLWLDATALEAFEERFPTLAASIAEAGLDPGRDWLPIAPAAHYLSGGVLTDLDGATALPALWAAGETACTGVHGANRLASNSLLEGMVFGARLADAIAAGRSKAEPTGAMAALWGSGSGVPCLVVSELAGEGLRPHAGGSSLADLGEGGEAATGGKDRTSTPELRSRLQDAMTAGAGVVRSGSSLHDAEVALEEVSRLASQPGQGEIVNLVTVARALLGSARMREESRGAHGRSDFPETSEAWRRRIVHARHIPGVQVGSDVQLGGAGRRAR